MNEKKNVKMKIGAKMYLSFKRKLEPSSCGAVID